MLEIRIFGIKFKFSFLFFAVITAMMICDKSGALLPGLICCAVHESGHVAAFLAMGKKPENISFEATGIKLTNPAGLLSPKKDLIVLCAGCAVNFIMAAAFYKISRVFFTANIVIGIFNLMPVYALDGGKIIYTLLCMRLLPHTARRIVNVISAAAIIPLLFFGGALMFYSGNVTLLLTSVYLLALLLFKTGE